MTRTMAQNHPPGSRSWGPRSCTRADSTWNSHRNEALNPSPQRHSPWRLPMSRMSNRLRWVFILALEKCLVSTIRLPFLLTLNHQSRYSKHGDISDVILVNIMPLNQVYFQAWVFLFSFHYGKIMFWFLFLQLVSLFRLAKIC